MAKERDAEKIKADSAQASVYRFLHNFSDPQSFQASVYENLMKELKKLTDKLHTNNTELDRIKMENIDLKSALARSEYTGSQKGVIDGLQEYYSNLKNAKDPLLPGEFTRMGTKKMTSISSTDPSLQSKYDELQQAYMNLQNKFNASQFKQIIEILRRSTI